MTVPNKSSAYMFGHVVLPKLFYETPDAVLSQPEIVAVRHYRNGEGVVVAALDLPKPTTVPEPHGVVMVLSPERLYFVLERASEDHIRRHRAESWLVMSSDAPMMSPSDHIGYLCSWLPDRSHFNHTLVKLHIDAVLQQVAKTLGTTSDWVRCETSDLDPSIYAELGTRPVHAFERPLPPEASQWLRDEVTRIVGNANTAKEQSDAAGAIMALIRKARALYGERSAEITLLHRTVLRLYLEAGDQERAVNVCVMWVKYCHRFRGSRAPETHLAYTWSARIWSMDRSLTPEQRRNRIENRLGVRNMLVGGVDCELPGGDDPDATVTTIPVHGS